MNTFEIIITSLTKEAATKIYIYNIYNLPKSSDYRTSCLSLLRTVLSAYQKEEQIILNNFNLYYKLWGGPTVQERDPKSDNLIDIIKKYQLGSFLPAVTVTYNNNNIQTYIDLYYGIQNLIDRVVKYKTDYKMDHNLDHLSITTILNFQIIQKQQIKTHNWFNINKKKLRAKLALELPIFRYLKLRQALDRYVREVTKAI